MTDQKYKLVPLTLTPEMGHTGDALIDADYSMQGIWDGMLEVAPEPVCRRKPLQGYSGMYFQGCVNDPEKQRARMVHDGDKFCARCGKRIEVEVVGNE